MKNLLERDKKNRRVSSKKENKRLVLKYLCSNRFLNLNTRWFLHCKLEKISSRNTFVQLKNRCVKTFRSRSILRSFRFSRIIFRDCASSGKIFGLIKESW